MIVPILGVAGLEDSLRWVLTLISISGPILLWPSFPVECNRCGKSGEGGFLQIIWYCKDCRISLNDEERKTLEASEELSLRALKQILERKARELP